jgi:hypothetical protein
MSSQIRILQGPNEGTTFELNNQFIRIGSDSSNEICLAGAGIPAAAMVLEFQSATKSYRIHDRSHGRLFLNGQPLPSNGEIIWEHHSKVSIEDMMTLVLENKTETMDMPLPPPLPAYEASSVSKQPKSSPPPIKKTEISRSEPKAAKTEPKPRQTSSPVRLTSQPAAKNKTMEMIQMIGIIVVAGLICGGILYWNSHSDSEGDRHTVRSYSALTSELYSAVQNKTMPQKYMDTLTYGREGEKKSPQQTLKSYIEMKQDILLKKEKKNYVQNYLDDDLLGYISQRIGYLQRQLTKNNKRKS